jgi:hypothetical protein
VAVRGRGDAPGRNPAASTRGGDHRGGTFASMVNALTSRALRAMSRPETEMFKARHKSQRWFATHDGPAEPASESAGLDLVRSGAPFPAAWGLPPTAPAMQVRWAASHIRQAAERAKVRASSPARTRSTLTWQQAAGRLLELRRWDPYYTRLSGWDAQRGLERRWRCP